MYKLCKDTQTELCFTTEFAAATGQLHFHGFADNAKMEYEMKLSNSKATGRTEAIHTVAGRKS